jgi:hypothetical protein
MFLRGTVLLNAVGLCAESIDERTRQASLCKLPLVTVPLRQAG